MEDLNVRGRRIDITTPCMRLSIKVSLMGLVDQAEDMIADEEDPFWSFDGIVWASVAEQLPALLDELDALRAKAKP